MFFTPPIKRLQWKFELRFADRTVLPKRDVKALVHMSLPPINAITFSYLNFDQDDELVSSLLYITKNPDTVFLNAIGKAELYRAWNSELVESWMLFSPKLKKVDCHYEDYKTGIVEVTFGFKEVAYEYHGLTSEGN